MAIAYRDTASIIGGTGSSLTINKPTGTADGDILLAVVACANARVFNSIPSGWTEITASGSDGKQQGRFFWLRAGASEPSDYTWGMDGSGNRAGRISAFSGAIVSGNPIDVSAFTPYASGTDRTAPSITTTVADTMCVALIPHGSISAFVSTSSGYTLQAGTGHSASAYNATASTGATGTKAFALSKSGQIGGSLHLALIPDTGGGGGADHDLTVGNLVTGNPTLDNPAIAQVHVLGVANLSTAAPALGNPALGQAHALTVGNLLAGAPILDNPALSGFGMDVLDAGELVTGAPVLGKPALGQNHVLTIGNLLTGSPTLGNPELTEDDGEEPEPTNSGGTLTPTTWENKWALESLTM